jgi:hypothetical protein
MAELAFFLKPSIKLPKFYSLLIIICSVLLGLMPAYAGDSAATGPMSINCPAGSPTPRIELFWDKNFGTAGKSCGSVQFSGVAVSYVGDCFNDQASSLKVYSGTWRLYQDINFNHGSDGAPIQDYIDVGPGSYGYIGDIGFKDQQAGDHWNDSLTSLQPVACDPPSPSNPSGQK